jgi:hypothetical protein
MEAYKAVLPSGTFPLLQRALRGRWGELSPSYASLSKLFSLDETFSF